MECSAQFKLHLNRLFLTLMPRQELFYTLRMPKSVNDSSFFSLFYFISDGLLTLSDFASLCRALFRNDQGKAYSINEKHLQDMFDVFDLNEVNLRYYH